MEEAIHNEKWPVVEKAAAAGYGSTLFTMPSGVAGPVRPLRAPRAPSASIAARSNEEEAGGDRGPQTRRQGFDLFAAV